MLEWDLDIETATGDGEKKRREEKGRKGERKIREERREEQRSIKEDEGKWKLFK